MPFGALLFIPLISGLFRESLLTSQQGAAEQAARAADAAARFQQAATEARTTPSGPVIDGTFEDVTDRKRIAQD